MPTTSNFNLTYPASTGHARLWEHIQQLAEDSDTALLTLLNRIEFLSDPPRAQLRQTSAQTIADSTYTAINFEVEEIDNYAGHDTGSNTSRYTCQYAGWYQLAGTVAWNVSASGRRVSAWRKNGSTIVDGSQVSYDVDAATWEHAVPARTMDVQLAVGDYIELVGFQNTGGNLATIVAFTTVQSNMTVRWIGNA